MILGSFVNNYHREFKREENRHYQVDLFSVQMCDCAYHDSS